MKLISGLAAALMIGFLVHDAAVAQSGGGEANVAPTINQNFKSEELDVSRWAESFSGESREVFAAREEVMRAVGLKPGQAAADIGAGTGIYVRLFARDVGANGKVYAVDIAPNFLEYIRSWAKEEKLGQIETILGEDQTPNLAPNSVDVIFSSDAYHHFEYPMTMLRNMRAALRDGGQMIVVDFERTPDRLDHVRAPKETVIQEIKDAGFRFVEEVKIQGFKNNYFLRFARD